MNFKDKWDQYLGFIPSMFIAPDVSFIDHTIRLGNISTLDKIFSMIILIIVLISVSLFRHSKLAVVSVYWVLISFFILVVIGWGSVENGMVLYSSYFMWAYLIPIALIFSRVFKEKVYIGKLVLIITIVALLIHNSIEIINYVYNLHSYR